MSFLDELKAHCERVSEAPDAYPHREDLGAGVRMAVHGRYLILFRVEPMAYASSAFCTAHADRRAGFKLG
jgi:plasmid stabilization system protein ParE